MPHTHAGVVLTPPHVGGSAYLEYHGGAHPLPEYAATLRPAIADLAEQSMFEDVAYWSRGGTELAGYGGVRVHVHGQRRLETLARVWKRIVATAPANDLIGFVSSVFDEASPTTSLLHIPQHVCRWNHGQRSQTSQQLAASILESILAGEDAAALAVSSVEQPTRPAVVSKPDYQRNVARVLDAITTGTVRKVVLARDELVAGDDADWFAALARLKAEFDDCWVFAVGGLFGATPEMLIAKAGARLTSRVLAGSLPRGGDEAEDALAQRLRTDERFAAEHFFAADSVGSRLARRVHLDTRTPEPFVLTLPNILHLASDFAGDVIDTETNVLELVALIHPTAAVSGTPMPAALDAIRAIEARDRGRYAGPVGWMDAAGNGEIGLALRCGQVEDRAVRLFSGGGIVAGADPAAELAETVSKMLPMKRALGQ